MHPGLTRCSHLSVYLLKRYGHDTGRVCTIGYAGHWKEAWAWGSMSETVKNPLAMQETAARSLGQEDPLEKGMATHSSILAWRVPWTEKLGGLPSMSQGSDIREQLAP